MMWILHERHHTLLHLLFERYDVSSAKTKDGELVVELLKKEISQEDLGNCKRCLPLNFPFFMITERLEIYKPPVEKKDNPEYRRRLERLRVEQQAREYKLMTKTIDAGQKYGRDTTMENFGQELRSANRHLIVVVNTLLTVGGAFAFGFFGIHIAYPHLNLDMARRMIIGLVLGIIVFFADLYFIVKGMGDDIESNTAAESTTVLDFKKAVGSYGSPTSDVEKPRRQEEEDRKTR
uniref:Endoplasmic reticulum-based factor for assembly of v-atpase n=1 Tax=Steinernema glaseri TaxID=37863 RepID=A0A1I7Z0M3_9BILA